MRDDLQQDEVKKERLEVKFGYDVMDNKSYRESIPEEMLKIDYLKQSKSGPQLQLLSKINSKIFILDYYRVNTAMAIALGDALAS